jgi:hypothetical protein
MAPDAFAAAFGTEWYIAVGSPRAADEDFAPSIL